MNGTRSRTSVAAALILVVVVVAMSVVVVMQRIEASRLSRAIAKQKSLLKVARHKLHEGAALQDDYLELSSRLGGRLPSCNWSDQLPYMVGQLSGLIESTGLRMETLQPEPMTSAKGILRFPMRVSIQIGLAALTKILKDMDKATPLLRIERLDLRNAQGNKDALQVGMTVASFVVLDERAPVRKRHVLARLSAAANKEKQAAKGAPKPATPASTTGKPNPPTGKLNLPTGRPNPPTGKLNLPTGRPNPPTGKPNPPTRKPNPPTGKPNPPTRKPNPPTGKPNPPTGKLNPPTRKPNPPTRKPNPPTGKPNPPPGKIAPAPTLPVRHRADGIVLPAAHVSPGSRVPVGMKLDGGSK